MRYYKYRSFLVMNISRIAAFLIPFLLGSACSASAASVKSSRAAEPKRPNIILFLVDDMGWGDLDSNWSQQKLNGRTVERKNEFKTPALSALAREGIQLRRHYSAAPVCAPARASLLLGVHQGEFPRGEKQPFRPAY